MSVTLHPEIGALPPDGLFYTIYRQLYNNFFNAQDKKDDEHPWGIEEGDELSVRLKNTAYGFAEAIAGAVNGETAGGSGTGGVLLNYLLKSGGDMSGRLRALYSFEAGIGNVKLLETIHREFTNELDEVVAEERGIRILDRLEIGADKLYIGGKRFLSYNGETDAVQLQYGKINFGNSLLFSKGSLLFGTDEQGVFISPNAVRINGHAVYHVGNANLSDVDWRMKNGTVYGDLSVSGKTTLNGKLTAKQDFEIGVDGKTVLSIAGDNLQVESNIAFGRGFGIKIEGVAVLTRLDADIQIGSIGGDLLLGNGNTRMLRLMSNLTDIDGDYTLITPYGAAYFPDSFRAAHDYGDMLLSTYRVDRDDEGVVIHKRLRFGSDKGVYLYGDNGELICRSAVDYVNPDTHEKQVFQYAAALSFAASTSALRPLDRVSHSIRLTTESDFFLFQKGVESTSHIGIDNSFTRMQHGALFLTNEHFLSSVADGIKHFGKAYFTDDLTSEAFSTGYAGSGWGIIANRATGNMGATFDELTVRKKMRVYEMEVQKISASNGALWISDHCCGDKVIKLTD